MNINKNDIEQLINTKLEQAEKQYGQNFKLALIEIISLEKILTPTQKKESNKIPLSEWKKYHDYPTVGSLRQFYFNRETNGFDYCVEYGGANGKRILINEDKFFEWHNNRQKQFRSNING